MSGDAQPKIRKQLESIREACKLYDSGRREEALKIAGSLLILFHETRDAKALLDPHNGASSLKLLSTTTLPLKEPQKRHSLGFLGLDPSVAGFRPFLGNSERKEEILLQKWWEEEPVMTLMRGPSDVVTRRQLVLASTAADTTDERRMKPEDYARLKDGLTLAVDARFRDGITRRVKLTRADFAALRQIGHEILSSRDIWSVAGLQSATAKAPPPRVEIEKEMNRYVRNFGGSLVTDMLGTTSPPFPNADYVFRVENIVAELKCLCEDKTDDEKLQASIQKLFDGYVDRGLIPNPGYGKFVVQSKDLPVELQNDLYRILARPIKRRLDKANKQIKRTKEHLKMDSAHGLVLLANDGNFKLEPAQFAHAVNVALGNDFSAIDNLVLFTVNMLATVPKMERHALVWMSASRNGHPVVSEEFLNRFFVGWTRHISSVIGEEVPIVGPIEHIELQSAHYDRTISKKRK